MTRQSDKKKKQKNRKGHVLWREWEALPDFMRTEAVRPYYDSLNRKKGQLFLKRVFDFTVSSLMLAALSPVLAVLAILIRLDSEGPVFYRQERVTQYGRRFRIYKFRTMIQDADKKGSLVTTQGDARITRMGKKLRGCRLDELPQLINIWKGEMSFVGTRPEVVKYVKQYTDEMYATLLLPAGVTSEASVQFKDEDQRIAEENQKGLSIDEAYVKRILPEKMKWNLKNMEEFNIYKEMRLILKTVYVVVNK
ncbi:MAG: sugar transferase [Clostridium sp.]|nr:sugar transferase [Clostridium sp.]